MLERAAVVGRHFSRSAVAALLPRDGGDLDARLESLRRSELIERDTGWFLGEPVLRFHHVLIRDAAYRRLLKGTRAELHAPLRRLDRGAGRRRRRARRDHRLASRAGAPAPARARPARRRRARASASAPRNASPPPAAARSARDDLPLAAGLLGRAIDRLDADDPARADLALDWCEALLAAGDVGPAAQRSPSSAASWRAPVGVGAGTVAGDGARPTALRGADDAPIQRRERAGRPPARLAHLLHRPAHRADRAAGAARHGRRGRRRGGGARGARRRRRRGEGALRARAGAGAARQGRRLRGGARPRARRGAQRRRSPPRQRRARRRAARRALGTEPGDARQRPLPRRRARAAHHAGRAGGRSRGAQLSGRPRSAARPHRGGAAHDRLVAQDGRGARHHAPAASRPTPSPAASSCSRATRPRPSAACAAPTRVCAISASASTRRAPAALLARALLAQERGAEAEAL